jgi:uncharacterized SAM-binding protein YcdF (DUF218 family)
MSIKRKIIIGLTVFLVLLIVIRRPILRGIGDILIKEDALQQVDAMFVLSGDAFDRGNEATRIYKAGYTKHIVCPGGNIQKSIKALGLNYYESELTKIDMARNGVPDSTIVLVKEGTSTFEEAQAMLTYCKIHKLKKVMVLSALFHTRRVNYCYRKLFNENGIQLVLRGAPSSDYNEKTWWYEENGMIMVNNEYIKFVVYLWKY